MGTRSIIARRLGSGKIRAIYCHWDGYPSHNGRILVNHYTDTKKIDELLDLGNLSSLGPEIGEKHDFDDNGDVCTAFGRDRGDAGEDAQLLSNVLPEEIIDSFSIGGIDYVYLWENESWTCLNRRNEIQDLSEFVEKEKPMEEENQQIDRIFIFTAAQVAEIFGAGVRRGNEEECSFQCGSTATGSAFEDMVDVVHTIVNENHPWGTDGYTDISTVRGWFK